MELLNIRELTKCKPFVKWVGGKTQMLKHLKPFLGWGL